jgi:hypothetical protein
MATEVILHTRKRELDRVVVWRVWRKKFTADTSSNLVVSADSDYDTHNIPSTNHFLNIRALVNLAIVHDNY